MGIIYNKELIKSKSFWQGYVEGRIMSSTLPDISGQTMPFSKGRESLSLKLAPTQLVSLQTLAGSSHFLRQIAILAAIKLCLFQYNGSNFISIGIPASQKSLLDAGKTNMLPLISEVQPQMTFRDLLQSIKRSIVEVYTYENYPMTVLKKQIKLEEMKLPLFSFVVAERGRIAPYDLETSQLLIEISKLEQDCSLELIFDASYFSRSSVEIFKNHLSDVLRLGLSNPGRLLSDFSSSELSHQQEGLPSGQQARNLQKVEGVLRQHKSVLNAKVLLKQSENETYLSALLIKKPGELCSNQLLRMYLQKNLPADLVPIELIWIEAEDGELTWPEPQQVSELEAIKPRNSTELLVARVWSEVLSKEVSSINDNFFEVGGDSILSIQVYYKLKQLGLELKPTDIIAYPTILSLVEQMESSKISGIIFNEQGAVVGPVPLSASQQWFFSKEFTNPHYYNNCVAYEWEEKLDPKSCQTVVQHLLEHHDVLRTKFRRTGSEWTQAIALKEEQPCFFSFNLASLRSNEAEKAIELELNKYHKKINIEEGPLILFLHFQLGAGSKDRLAIIGHRLISDNLSLEILIEDFAQSYSQIKRGFKPSLPNKTTSYKHWSEQTKEVSKSKGIINELAYWSQDAYNAPITQVVDDPEGLNLEASTEISIASLDEESTRCLTSKCFSYLGANVKEIVYFIFLQTLKQQLGSSYVIVESGGHGRQTFSEELDLSRTVGWFTTNFPLYLEWSMGSEDLLHNLKEVSSQLRHLPNQGMGYGLLRFMNKEEKIETLLREHQAPAIGFDFQGIFKQGPRGSQSYVQMEHVVSMERDPSNARLYELDISSWVFNDIFSTRWSYSKNRLQASTAKMLMDRYINNLQTLIDQYLRK